eukprot:m.661964 g.661964  ORF g.661964 m.661964 type:complete len:706 (-) comp22738_c0_seq8:2500-4617(-)
MLMSEFFGMIHDVNCFASEQMHSPRHCTWNEGWEAEAQCLEYRMMLSRETMKPSSQTGSERRQSYFDRVVPHHGSVANDTEQQRLCNLVPDTKVALSQNVNERRMTTVGLLLIAFFWVCGGIYGNEELLLAAPPGIVFVLLLVCPFVYALPICIINVELATALPYDGGLVTWVEEACGRTIGLQNMYWLWISRVFDAAAYPSLASQYIGKRMDLSVFDGSSENGESIVSMMIIACVTLIKLAGTDWLVRASGVFFFLSLMPTLIYMIYGSKELQWGHLTTVDAGDEGINKSLLISWVLWLYVGFLRCKIAFHTFRLQLLRCTTCVTGSTRTSNILPGSTTCVSGWIRTMLSPCFKYIRHSAGAIGNLMYCMPNIDYFSISMCPALMLVENISLFPQSLGALAGEVIDPSKSYPKVITVLIPVVTIVIVWPLAVSVSLDQTRANYKAGHFEQSATALCGDWLGVMFVLGAFFSFVGLYNAQVVVCERSMAASLAQNLAGCVAGGNTDTSCVARYLCTANGTGVAPVYILFNAVVSAALVWLPYEALIEFAMLQFTVCSFCLVYAYTWYKVVRPDMHRPLSVPGGLAGGIFVSVPVVAIGMVNLYFGCVDEEEVFGVPYAKAVGLAFFTIAGALVHVTHRLVFRCIYNRWPTPTQRRFHQLAQAGSPPDTHKPTSHGRDNRVADTSFSVRSPLLPPLHDTAQEDDME